MGRKYLSMSSEYTASIFGDKYTDVASILSLKFHSKFNPAEFGGLAFKLLTVVGRTNLRILGSKLRTGLRVSYFSDTTRG
jgi:hypothetical protein